MGHEADNRYHVQGKMNGRGRRWKNYFYSNEQNVAMDSRDQSAGFTEDSGVGWKWRVWDTETDQEVKGRHYDFNDILHVRAMQENKLMREGKPIAEGSKVVLELQKGDTAYMPGSTKHMLYGPIRVTYWIHASGWNYDVDAL